MPTFAAIVLIVLIVLGAAATVLVAIVADALWGKFGPELHCRAPKTDMLVQTYRPDVRDGEGRRIKVAPDLRIRKLIGASWRLKFFVGIIVWEKESSE